MKKWVIGLIKIEIEIKRAINPITTTHRIPILRLLQLRLIEPHLIPQLLILILLTFQLENHLFQQLIILPIVLVRPPGENLFLELPLEVAHSDGKAQFLCSLAV